MKHRKHLLILFLLLALSACTQPTAAPSATPLPPTHTQPSPTGIPASITPTQTITLPTMTTTPEAGSTMQPTSTETATMTSEILDQAHLEYRCLEINPEPPEAGLYTGTIVLQAENPFRYELLNLSTSAIQPLLEDEEQTAYVEAISPDNKWLAYTVLHPGTLFVTTLVGDQPTYELPWDNAWFDTEKWLDNSHLEISLTGEAEAEILLNPFSGEQTSLFYQLPNFADPALFSVRWYSAQFNPQLTRAVYLLYPEGDFISLWNLETQQQIAAFHSAVGMGTPVWSPDGSEFVIALTDVTEDDDFYSELYRISQNGEQQKITNLRAYYTEYLMIWEYQWSPNGLQIAFWLRYSQNGQAKDQLAVIDMETYQVTNYCIDDRWGTSRELIWSPDGHQIVVDAKYGEEAAVLLLDLENQRIYRIAKDARARGWLISSP